MNVSIKYLHTKGIVLHIHTYFLYRVLDLFRQETPRQSILKSPNIPEHGIWIDWLKESYEKKKNYTRTNDTIPLLRFLDVS